MNKAGKYQTLGIGQVSITQIGVAQDSLAQIGIPQNSKRQVGSFQIGVAQVSKSQIGTPQISSSQVSLAQVNTNQVPMTQSGTEQTGITKISTSQISTIQVSSSQVNSPKIDLAQFDPHRAVSSPQINTSKISFPSRIASEQFFSIHSSLQSLSEVNTKRFFAPQIPFSISFQVAALPTGQLAEAQITKYDQYDRPNGGTILIDDDAAEVIEGTSAAFRAIALAMS